VEAVGVVGNCVGTYFAMHISAYDIVKCAFSTHPSHREVVTLFFPDEDEEDLYPPIVENGAVQYFGPSLEEGDNYRPGGLAEEMLGDLLTIVEYPCHHGYFSRGYALDDPFGDGCADQAYGDLLAFLAQNL